MGLGVGAFYEEDSATDATLQCVLQFCHISSHNTFQLIQVEEAESNGNWIQQVRQLSSSMLDFENVVLPLLIPMGNQGFVHCGISVFSIWQHACLTCAWFSPVFIPDFLKHAMGLEIPRIVEY